MSANQTQKGSNELREKVINLRTKAKTHHWPDRFDYDLDCLFPQKIDAIYNMDKA